MTNPSDIAGLLERLRAALDDIRFPLTLVETEDYAEVVDEDGVKVALTVKPHLFSAVNALPDLLQALEAAQAKVGRYEAAFASILAVDDPVGTGGGSGGGYRMAEIARKALAEGGGA